MSFFFKPSGSLDVATEQPDLPEQTQQNGDVISNALARCKNLRLDQTGVIKTRDGSSKVNTTALGVTAISRIIEQAGVRYVFAGSTIYRNEVSIATGLTNAAWSAVRFNPFNSTTQSIYCTNGTDKKRIEGSTVYEWGITAPTVAPTLAAVGAGGWPSHLTGTFNYKYTYCRFEGTVLVSESNPSPAGAAAVSPSSEHITVTVTPSSDSQVNGYKFYRTTNNGDVYYYASWLIDTGSNVWKDRGWTTSETGDENLGTEVVITNYPPPAGVALQGPTYNGIIFIVVDNNLYFTSPRVPDSCPATYYIEVSQAVDPGICVVIYNGQPFYLTKHRIYQIQGTGPDTFFPYPLKAFTGAQNADAALAVEGQGIFHWGTDGIYLYAGVDKKISQGNFNPVMRGETVNGIPGMTSSANNWIFRFKNKVYFGYTSAGYTYPSNIVVLNIDNQRMGYFSYGREIRCLAVDEQNDRILAADNSGFLWVLEDTTVSTDGGTAIAWETESKSFGLQTRRMFPVYARYDVDASLATGAKGEVILDGTVLQTHTLTENRQTKKRIIAGGNGKRLSTMISGTGPVSIYAIEIG
jgi:hypothetical protein